MSSRGVKIKKITSKQINIGVIQDMFGQMTGASEADIEIILPKYVNMRNLILKFCKVYKVLTNFKAFSETFPEYAVHIGEIGEFIDETTETLKLSSTDETESQYYDASQEDINILYRELKDDEHVKKIIETCAGLLQYKKYISDKSDLSGHFIKDAPGPVLYLLTFSNIDFKALWYSEKITKIIKTFFLTILNHTFNIGYKMYEIITSPDVDIAKFSKTIISSIDHLRTQIPRCDKAFDIIANSVLLLENNFDGYYKQSVQAQNPNLILENFVIDVSMRQNMNLSTKNQFKRIIIYMKQTAERSHAQSDNPQIKKIFKVLNSQFRLMEAHSEGDEEKELTEEDTELEKEYVAIVETPDITELELGGEIIVIPETSTKET